MIEAAKTERMECAVRPLRAGFVAEIDGINLSQKLSVEEVEFVRETFREFPVLIFHDQSLDPPALMAFGSNFGTLAPHTQLKYRVPDYPACSLVTNREPDGRVDEFGQNSRAVAFHSDGSFKAVPDAITILHGIEVPSSGGGTEFADCRAAWDALPDDWRQRVQPLKARHRLHKGVSGTPGPAKRAPEVENHPGSVHPVVRTLPESGRRSIYVNPVHTECVEGVGADESRELLAALIAHCTAPAFRHVHGWRRGDVVMWDQRCTLHRAAGGAPAGEARVLLRVMIVTGEAPV